MAFNDKGHLSQQGCEGHWGRWITKIQDYDLELKPIKLGRGPGLKKLMNETICRSFKQMMI